MNFLNNRIFTLAISAFLMFTISSCETIKDIEYVGMKETKLQSLGISKGTVKIVLEYFNPNKFGVDIKETQLEVYVNDKYVGIAENPEKNIVPKSSNFDFPIYVHFNPLQALGLVSLFNQKEVNVRVKGTTKAGKSGVYVRVPVDVTEKVSLR